MVRPSRDIDMNPVKYYPLMINLVKCNGSSNYLIPKNMCSKRNKRHKMLKHLTWQQTEMKLQQWKNIFHVIVKANVIIQHVIKIKNGIIKHVNVNEKIILRVKKHRWDPRKCICENSKYLRSIADTSVTECH